MDNIPGGKQLNKKVMRISGIMLIVMALVLVAGLGVGMPAQAQEEGVDRQ